MLKIIEEKVALHYPLDLEVISKLNRRFFIAHKEILLEIRVRLALHQRKTLKTSTLIDRKD